MILASGNPWWVHCIFPQSTSGLTSSELSLGHSHDEGEGGQILPWLCFARSRVERGKSDGGAARREGWVTVLWETMRRQTQGFG